MKSNCCNAEMHVEGDETRYYVCNKCENACDRAPRLKSSCCGAEASRSFGESDDLHCLKCLRKCKAVENDVMSKKEILEFCEKWKDSTFDFDRATHDVFCKTTDAWVKLETFFRQAKRVIKSIKEHLK